MHVVEFVGGFFSSVLGAMQYQKLAIIFNLFALSGFFAATSASVFTAARPAPIVLNTVSPKPWQDQSSISSDYVVDVSMVQRIESGILGFGQLALATAVLALPPMLIMGFIPMQVDFSGLFIGTALLTVLLCESRLLMGGVANTWNAFASSGLQWTMKSRERLKLGIAELSVAGVYVLVLLFGSLFRNDSGFEGLYSVASPACWALGIFGVADIVIAEGNMLRGLAIVRF